MRALVNLQDKTAEVNRRIEEHTLQVQILILQRRCAHLEVVGGGVKLPTAFVLAAERLLANVGLSHLPVVLILQHNLGQARL